MTATPVIDAVDIARWVGARGSVPALRNATFRVAEGEFVAIVGPSGSGKTTLLSILGLLDRPSTGSYFLDGVDTTVMSERERNRVRGQHLGFVFQNAYLVGGDSAAENVDLGLRVRGVPAGVRRRAAQDALARVGLGDAGDKPAGSLSGGEKQRVAVARALVTSPRVILADEPTGALDAASTHNLIELLLEINQSGTTVIVVTHDPLVAEASARRLLIVDGILSESVKAQQAAR